jgi:glycosyltransferase involved in cell wall biosynthesis
MKPTKNLYGDPAAQGLRITAVSMEDMQQFVQIRRIAFVGNYLPRKCGIATFTHDLRCGFAKRFTELSAIVAAVNDSSDGYPYPPEVRFEFTEKDPMSYDRLADFINSNKVDCVCLQHEYGIYGGDCGEMLLKFLRNVKVPVVTTLHTILLDPNPQQRRILKAILALCSRVVTMTDKGRQLLRDVYQADLGHVDLIPHGIPDFTFSNPDTHKAPLGFEGRKVILTFGLLSPNKGIEYAIQALPRVVEKFPDVLYVVLGQTHPHLIRENGEAYRNSLVHLASENNVLDNLRFVNTFVELDLLKQYIAACDVYVTPYLHEAQITSGTLAYAFGMGTAVVSTPYWHAADLLKDGKGLLVPFRDANALSDAMLKVLSDDALRQKIRKVAFDIGRTMTWSRVSELYLTSYELACFDKRRTSRFVPEMAPETPLALPAVKLDHFHRMMDSTGLLQYATYSIPYLDGGYSIKQAARALSLLAFLKANVAQAFTAAEHQRATTLLSLIQFSMDQKDSNKVRSLLTYDRRWSGDFAEDTHGQVMSALGACARYGLHEDFAHDLFVQVMKTAESFESHVGIALALDGCSQYLIRFVADAPIVALRTSLKAKLVRQFQIANATKKENGWEWFGPTLYSSNAMVAQALISVGAETSDQTALDIGLTALGWLAKVQLDTDSTGQFFSPISSDSGITEAHLAQERHKEERPSEVQTLVAAALEAHRRTSESRWLSVATLAMDWFLGRNCVGRLVYDSKSGGAYDGIFGGTVNKNEGSDSTLSFLLALTELQRSSSF